MVLAVHKGAGAGDDGTPGRRRARRAGSLAGRPDVGLDLAAIVSGEAEQDFDKGYRINMDGTRALLEAVSGGAGYVPRFVFASSIAVFGAPFPSEAIGDEFFSTPLTSYGTQKAICELLIPPLHPQRRSRWAEPCRPPTVCVRPGAPNKAASGSFSNIIRESLARQGGGPPVADSVMHWHASPRAAVAFMRARRHRWMQAPWGRAGR